MGLTTGFSCLFDSTNRIIEYNLFIIPRLIDGYIDFINRYFTYNIPYGKELAFAFFTSAVLYINKYYNNFLSRNQKALLNFIYK